jgi:hypothetical protein
LANKSEYVKRTKRKRMALVSAFKVEAGCSRCDERHPACLDLHHLDPETKNPKLTKIKATGRYYTGGSRWVDLSFAEIESELEKCEVLCSNCHRKETALRLGWHTRTKEGD